MNHRWRYGPWKIVCINYESLDSISSSSNEGSMVQFILLCILPNKKIMTKTFFRSTEDVPNWITHRWYQASTDGWTPTVGASKASANAWSISRPRTRMLDLDIFFQISGRWMAYQTNRRAWFDRLAYLIALLFDWFHTYAFVE